ncbi:uncharacterized protein si:dkey-192g7.3 isoform X2 [Thunnus albacares]|uniref:uncharacterized protein si:dkey-192g7.3 isoform X2 n=2 Tax=Thunnus albacares TaxID=8236 RepID=UPI001CF6D10E|nr:uncharacterized protein si:dkey-192g7.3 isoform X2 [Thunnus albacares]
MRNQHILQEIAEPSECNMRTFLVLLMVLIASGEEEKTINGILEDSVLLPCSCPNRNSNKVFKWQMEKPPKTTLVFQYDEITRNSLNRYEGRIQTFVAENRENCSILLTNITEDDQGKYKCIFYIEEEYNRYIVNLNLSGKSHQRQSKQTSNPPTGSVSSMTHWKSIPVVVTLGFSLISEIFI